MRAVPRRRKGFTLVELMIVVAIIGVLALVAVPNFLLYQRRAKASESLANLKGIAVAEEAYFTEYGYYVSVPGPVPPGALGTAKLGWPGGSAFDLIGWSPEGRVWGHYAVSADAGGMSGRFTAEVATDLDGDAARGYWGYVKPAPGQGGLGGMLPGSTCEGTGTWDPQKGSKSAVATAGPCDAASGRTTF